MDHNTELREFLRSRRARLSVDDVEIGGTGRTRRVPGLRREEVAQLAGVSVDYYSRLEQGRPRNRMSPNVESRLPRIDAERTLVTAEPL